MDVPCRDGGGSDVEEEGGGEDGEHQVAAGEEVCSGGGGGGVGDGDGANGKEGGHLECATRHEPKHSEYDGSGHCEGT